MFPNDAKLAAQLCSVRFQMTAQGIAAEDKVSVIKRLGRSPDKADALVMAWVSRRDRRLPEAALRSARGRVALQGGQGLREPEAADAAAILC